MEIAPPRSEGIIALQRSLARMGLPAAPHPEGLSTWELTFAVLIVFSAGWYLCLPMAGHIELPWWAKRIEVVSTILLHEALFLVYLLFSGWRSVLRNLASPRYASRAASIAIITLAAWCATVSLQAPLPLHDLGRSLRLIVVALLFVAITGWASRDPLIVLKSFLIGLLTGSAVNLIFTFQHPLFVGVLPRLLGQNSPGPPMGIAVCLAGWLILLSRRRIDTALAIAVVLVCGAGALISYSKIGMFAAFVGFAGLPAVAGKVVDSKRGRVLVLALISVVIVGVLFFRGVEGSRIYSAWTEMVSAKLASARFSESHSMQARWIYVQGVAEIVSTRPIGVGYSGFRDAMIRTKAYQNPNAANEGSLGPEDSNPHGTFLYYASAGGIVGGVLSVAIYVMLCKLCAWGFRPFGNTGRTLVILISSAYFVIAMSVPYLINSVIMILPVGVAAGVGIRARHRSSEIVV